MTSTARVPRSLLCGLDGVLRVHDDDTTAALEHAFGIARGTVDAVAFAPERATPALTGAVTDTEWRLSVAAALVPELGSIDRAADFVSRWSSPAGHVDESVQALLMQVRRRGLRVVLVANATTRLETDLSVLGLHAAVDAVVSSARVGHVLPARAVYAEALRAAGVPAEDCLFVDAVESHVVAARELGMTGHDFTGVDGLRQVLAPLLRFSASGEPNGKARGSGGRARGPGGQSEGTGESRAL